MEEWKCIEGYCDSYEVSNMGRVRSKDRTVILPNGNKRKYKQIIKSTSFSRGYPKVDLNKNNKMRSFTIHRLVMRAFVGHSDLQVNHKDGDTTNNFIDNLEYVTSRENYDHAICNKLYCKHKRLNSTDINNIINENLTHLELSKKYDVSIKTISRIFKNN